MSSSKECLNHILNQLSDLDDIEYRPMMGEFILYYHKKIFGGIYDNRFLVKDVRSAVRYLSAVTYSSPYEGGRKMLSVDRTGDRDYIQGLVKAMYDELPEPKRQDND